MHPNLSSNLHTDECNLIIEALQKCHKENPFGKFLGQCNDLDRQMHRCLRQERADNQKRNFDESRKKISKTQDRIRNSKDEE
ncbi:COX assembly mitochondrial protein 2 homolog [Phlebotomus argentipes]|uniref:COX assembly mitochondrial protein 2 homolog n=1 Tax=Phlebotomus argentipes TaxID=94469 RepID=UPI002892E038|nr:COX assembly mitochondrial protein 2 homolog [Phlebotomus argentipes]